jgi:hypothetical protein
MFYPFVQNNAFRGFDATIPPPQRDEENDTGLLAHLLAGGVLKNFVLMELRKQSTWSETQPRFFY